MFWKWSLIVANRINLDLHEKWDVTISGAFVMDTFCNRTISYSSHFRYSFTSLPLKLQQNCNRTPSIMKKMFIGCNRDVSTKLSICRWQHAARLSDCVLSNFVQLFRTLLLRSENRFSFSLAALKNLKKICFLRGCFNARQKRLSSSVKSFCGLLLFFTNIVALWPLEFRKMLGTAIRFIPREKPGLNWVESI